MGFSQVPNKCFITDAQTKTTNSDLDAMDYLITYGGRNYYFIFPWDYENSNFVNENLHVLRGLMLNNKFQDGSDSSEYDSMRLESLISKANIPRSPKNKLDNLLLYLFNKQEYPGEILDIDGDFAFGQPLYLLYFKNFKEFFFYLESLKEQNLIKFTTSQIVGRDEINIKNLKLTFDGLQYIIDLQEKGQDSNNCFIAMSFSESSLPLRESIKSAIVKSGYVPVLIDEIHYEADITINDAIIASIKKCKFLVADFTEQRHGVYFETGYALGKDKPVIYMCNSEDFSNTHFDTNHYPHIVYSDLNELEAKLSTKIDAWI
jgi:nucleoside 2-deoxyribosyltransferase